MQRMNTSVTLAFLDVYNNNQDVNTFDHGFYLNGEYLGVAAENCRYDGHLYPAFSFQKNYAYGFFIFDRNHMNYMPDGYEPIY